MMINIMLACSLSTSTNHSVINIQIAVADSVDITTSIISEYQILSLCFLVLSTYYYKFYKLFDCIIFHLVF